MGKTPKELVELANDLTTNDLAKLLDLVGNRIMVSVGQYKYNWVSFNGIDATTNGTLVQLSPQDSVRNHFNLERTINKINNN